jgi:hypothetical protein
MWTASSARRGLVTVVSQAVGGQVCQAAGQVQGADIRDGQRRSAVIAENQATAGRVVPVGIPVAGEMCHLVGGQGGQDGVAGGIGQDQGVRQESGEGGGFGGNARQRRGTGSIRHSDHDSLTVADADVVDAGVGEAAHGGGI